MIVLNKKTGASFDLYVVINVVIKNVVKKKMIVTENNTVKKQWHKIRKKAIQNNNFENFLRYCNILLNFLPIY